MKKTMLSFFTCILLAACGNVAVAAINASSNTQPISCDNPYIQTIFPCGELSLAQASFTITSIGASTVQAAFWNPTTSPAATFISPIGNTTLSAGATATILDGRVWNQLTSSYSTQITNSILFLGDGITPNIHAEFPTFLPTGSTISLRVTLNGKLINYGNYSVVGGSASKQYIDIIMPVGIWFNGLNISITSTASSIPVNVWALFFTYPNF